MRHSLKRTVLSQCVLLALTSFAAQAQAGAATPCQNGDTTKTCGLSFYDNTGYYYQDKGVDNAVMADKTATDIYMDGHRSPTDSQTLTVSGTDMTGYYIQGSTGGTADINVTNNAKVDMVEVGSAKDTTNTTVNIDHATLNGENSAIKYGGKNKSYMMGAAIYVDPLDKGAHNVNVSNGSVLHGSIISAGAGTQNIAISNSTMDNAGIYTGSATSDVTVSLTNATLDASNSQVAKKMKTLVDTLSKTEPFSDINLDAFSDVAIAMYGTTHESLTLNNSTVTGDVGIINDKGQVDLSVTNNSVVNGNVTLNGNATDTILVDNSTINGDVNTSQNSGNTTVTLQITPTSMAISPPAPATIPSCWSITPTSAATCQGATAPIPYPWMRAARYPGRLISSKPSTLPARTALLSIPLTMPRAGIYKMAHVLSPPPRAVMRL